MGIAQSINRTLESATGFKLVRPHREPPRSPDACYMEDANLQARLTRELVDVALSGLAPTDVPHDRQAVAAAVDELLTSYDERPEQSGEMGQSQFHNLFWIYLTARLLGPDVVVESGVFRGQSLWALHRACPDAEVHAYDVDLSHLIERRDGVAYHECDWSSTDVEARGRTGLAFFDCHVNQARRVREAYDRGFRTLLFDDAPPAHRLYAYGAPGAPTIPMLFDDSLRDGQVIRWQWKGQTREHIWREDEARDTAQLIDGWWTFPDVGAQTMFGGFSHLTLVRLVP